MIRVTSASVLHLDREARPFCITIPPHPKQNIVVFPYSAGRSFDDLLHFSSGLLGIDTSITILRLFRVAEVDG